MKFWNKLLQSTKKWIRSDLSFLPPKFFAGPGAGCLSDKVSFQQLLFLYNVFCSKKIPASSLLICVKLRGSIISLAYSRQAGWERKTLTVACHENLWHSVVGLLLLFEDGLHVMTSKWLRGQCPACSFLGKHENNKSSSWIVIWGHLFLFMCNKPNQQTINRTLPWKQPSKS